MPGMCIALDHVGQLSDLRSQRAWPFEIAFHRRREISALPALNCS
jgi:hypothetical protein